MLSHENLLETLTKQMKTTDFFGSLVFQWNSEQKCFQLKSKWKNNVYKIRYFTSVLYTFLVLVHILWTWKNINIFIKLHSMFHFFALLLFIYTHRVFCTKAECIVSYLNGMLLSENHWKGQNWNSNINIGSSKLTKIGMKILEISCVAVPLFGHMDLLRNPCLPNHLGGYWLVTTQCGGQIGTDLKPTWSINEILTKLLVCFLSYINWSFLSSGSFFHAALALMLQSYCLKSYILLAGQKINKSLLEKGKSIWQSCLMYREIEVMATEYRKLYCYMTADLIVSSMLVHTISLYACFKFGIELPLSMFFMFSLSVVNAGLVVVGMYTSLANVYTASKYVLEVQLKTGKCNGPWFRRFLKSCKIVKVYVSDTNFAEPLTPLTAEQFSIDQTISLMLVKN